MATRAGVSEYSTSPRAQRSSERSIRASWTTGYWGAATPIRASMSTRWATTAPTIPRASSPAPGSASTSARDRSRTATGVRWPKSASNTAARATRLPARNDRMRSAGSLLLALLIECRPGTPGERYDGGRRYIAAVRPIAPPVGTPGGRNGGGGPLRWPGRAIRRSYRSPSVPRGRASGARGSFSRRRRRRGRRPPGPGGRGAARPPARPPPGRAGPFPRGRHPAWR
jgi:hypothetical protein